jgi:ketosteroid isomerase-like protein
MTNDQALTFLRRYFDALFTKRDLAALDVYLHPDYFDDDIGPGEADHIANSKAYLRDLFQRQPSIAVTVKDAIAQDDVITAFLEWSVVEAGARKTLHKGVAIFVLKDGKIYRRHTFLYFP